MDLPRTRWRHRLGARFAALILLQPAGDTAIMYSRKGANPYLLASPRLDVAYGDRCVLAEHVGVAAIAHLRHCVLGRRLRSDRAWP